MSSGTEASHPSVSDYRDTSYENRGGHRPDFLSIVVRAGVLGRGNMRVLFAGAGM